jgi:hypothetical protein
MPHPATFRRLVETARRRSATPGKLPFGDCQYRQPKRSLSNAPYRVRLVSYSTRSAGFHFLTADFW